MATKKSPAVETKTIEPEPEVQVKSGARSAETTQDTSQEPKKGLDLRNNSLAREIASKQPMLVSGTNIKTVNGQSLLGSGNLAADGHFKGWYDSASNLPANPVVGDYAYVKGATADDPAAIYECTTAGTWSDSGRTADTSNVQTFASGEEVNETYIDDTNLVNPADGALAKAEDVMQLKAKLEGVTAVEIKAANYPIAPGIIACRDYSTTRVTGHYYNTSGNTTKIAFVALGASKGVRFLGLKVKNANYIVGYVYLNIADIDTFLSGLTDGDDLAAYIVGGVHPFEIVSTQENNTELFEIISSKPEGANYVALFYDTNQNSGYAVKDTNFYCYLMSGDNVGDIVIGEYVKTASWSGEYVYYEITVNEVPILKTTSYRYITAVIENLKKGDVLYLKSRVGSSVQLGAKIKNGKVVSIINKVNTSPYEQIITVDDTFDAVVVNDGADYLSSPILTVKRSELCTEYLQNELNEISTEYNILCLGNSLTQCTMGYVPWIAKSVAPHLKFNLYFTYDGGSSLADYFNWLNGNAPANVTSFYKYNDGQQAWETISENITVDNVIGAKKWDLVTIQQTVDYNTSSWSTTFKPYVHKIHNILYNKLGYNFKFGYIETPVAASNNNRFDEMAANTVKMMTDTATEVLFPAGTALQNARTTYLDRFGAGTHLTGDGAHIAAGIGCLITAYANTLALLRFMGCEKSLIGNTEYPNDIYKYQHNVPLPGGSGNAVGLSKYNLWVAQQCAVMALKYPHQITDMVAAGMAGEYGVKLTLTNCTSSNPIESANSGETWATKLTAKDGATIGTVAVTMGGDAVAGAYDSETGVVTIENVSGDIVITES